MKEILVLLLVFFIYLSRGRKKRQNPTNFTKGQISPFFFFFLSVSGSSCSVWRPESKRWDHTHGEEYVLAIIPWSDSFSVVYSRATSGNAFDSRQFCLLSSYLWGSYITYGAQTSQRLEQVLLACVSEYRTQGYLSNTLRRFWLDCKNHRSDYLTQALQQSSDCLFRGIQPLLWACSVLFLWCLVSVFTILTKAEKIWSHFHVSLLIIFVILK